MYILLIRSCGLFWFTINLRNYESIYKFYYCDHQYEFWWI